MESTNTNFNATAFRAVSAAINNTNEAIRVLAEAVSDLQSDGFNYARDIKDITSRVDKLAKSAQRVKYPPRIGTETEAHQG